MSHKASLLHRHGLLVLATALTIVVTAVWCTSVAPLLSAERLQRTTQLAIEIAGIHDNPRAPGAALDAAGDPPLEEQLAQARGLVAIGKAGDGSIAIDALALARTLEREIAARSAGASAADVVLIITGCLLLAWIALLLLKWGLVVARHLGSLLRPRLLKSKSLRGLMSLPTSREVAAQIVADAAKAYSVDASRQELDRAVAEELQKARTARRREDLLDSSLQLSRLTKIHEARDVLLFKRRDWFSLSKGLFRLRGDALPSLEGKRGRTKAVELHRAVQRLVWVDALKGGLVPIVSALAWYGLAVLVGLCAVHTGGAVSRVAQEIMYGQLTGSPGCLQTVWWIFVAAWGGGVAAYYLAHALARTIAERTDTELDDVLATALTGPAVAAVAAFGAYRGVTLLPAYIRYTLHSGWRAATADGLPLALTALLATWVAVLLFNRVIMHVLERWARSTEQQLDDMFARLFRVFGSFVIVAISVGLVLVKYQEKIGTATGIDNVLLPYAIVVSVLTAILGYSVKEAVEVFFGSFLLQVDRPFDVGERLMLETGEICDVMSVGVRTTRLHNVLDNVEVSVPNRALVTQKITNISRPDLELRAHVTVHVEPGSSTAAIVEGILRDVAYCDVEVDQTCLASEEVPTYQRERGRRSVREHTKELLEVYPRLANLTAEAIQGTGFARSDKVAERMVDVLVYAEHLRYKYGAAVREAYGIGLGKEASPPLADRRAAWEWARKGEASLKSMANAIILAKRDASLRSPARADQLLSAYRTRGEVLVEIAAALGEVEDLVHIASDIQGDMRGSQTVRALLGELAKEPLVRSADCVTQDGAAYREVTLSIHITHLERRLEVTHRLDQEIRRRLELEGVGLLSPAMRSL